jgi:hypothetical protein
VILLCRTVDQVAQWGSQSVPTHAYNDLSSKRPIMWDEIQDMPGEIFDIEDWGHPLAECWHDMDLNVPDEQVAQEG